MSLEWISLEHISEAVIGKGIQAWTEAVVAEKRRRADGSGSGAAYEPWLGAEDVASVFTVCINVRKSALADCYRRANGGPW